jgi:heat shock protein HslJ
LGAFADARPQLRHRRLDQEKIMKTTRGMVLAASFAVLAACGQRTELPSELAGRWDFQQIAGASLGEGVDIWMEIDPANGAVTGFTGCNGFTATMSAFSEAISIGAMSEDDAACATPEAGVDEARFLGVLGSVQHYVRHGRSLELMSNASGEALLRLRNEDPAAPAE